MVTGNLKGLSQEELIIASLTGSAVKDVGAIFWRGPTAYHLEIYGLFFCFAEIKVPKLVLYSQDYFRGPKSILLELDVADPEFVNKIRRFCEVRTQ